MDRHINRNSGFDSIKIKGSHKVRKYISEMLTIFREALADLSSGHLCVATLQKSDATILITSWQALSPENIRAIKDRFSARLADENGLGRLTYLINGQTRGQYNFDNSGPSFQRQLFVPVSIESTRIGHVFVGSFDKKLTQKRIRLLRKWAANLPRALRHLWYLNRRQKAKFHLLSSCTIEGLILCDSRKRIHHINDAAKQLLNIPSEEVLLGEPLASLQANFLIDWIDEARREGIYEINKVHSVRRKRPMLIGTHIQQIKNFRNNEVGWMIDLRDVTKNWQNDQLRSALTLASHEMKTPLSSIKGAIDLLLENDLGRMNDKQKHCLHVIKDDIVRLNRLLSDILDLSRFDEGIQFLDRRKEISLTILIHKVTESFRSFARSKNIRIVNKVPRTIPPFKGPRDRLQQVVANLLENGIKYTLPGGRVTIEAGLARNQLTFVVKDTGVGIPESELDNIFQRFKQLDNYPSSGKQGFGLGLSISKEIVEAMGGKIWVESQVGVGSSFYFKIPV